MLKLKPAIRIKAFNSPEIFPEEKPKENPIDTKVVSSKEKPVNKKELPSDTYEEEFQPLEIPIDEHRKFIVSVKRGGDYGLPMCDIRQYNITDVYTGYTKKGITFPISFLFDLISALEQAAEKCGEKKLFEEFEE